MGSMQANITQTFGCLEHMAQSKVQWENKITRRSAGGGSVSLQVKKKKDHK